MRKFLQLLLGVLFLSSVPGTARAQGAARLSLYALQTSSYPSMTLGLDVFDPAGNFVSGLTPDAIQLIEDNQPLAVTSLEELQTGVEFALALDPGSYFAYRDAYAVTRFDKIVEKIQEWATTHADALGDDLSLVTTDGTPANHLATVADFSNALAAYHPDLQSVTSSPGTLSRALDVVLEPLPPAGRKPVVLYVTSVPDAQDIPALQNLTQRAVDQHIRVNIWMVASRDFFATSGATALNDLAIQTGGQVVQFSGEEPLPSLEMYLAGLRHAYRLMYSSQILTAGGHTLTAQVNLNGETISSEALPFELNVEPPNPILIDPPEEILRTAPDARTTDTTTFLPAAQEVIILIEFPDGRTRPISRTALYVDGVMVDENTTEPFDLFMWDLSGYATSAGHGLAVEAVDSYGLSRMSGTVPVQVIVVRPQVGLLPWLSRNSGWVALGGILFAGLVLGVSLTISSKRRLRGTSGASRPSQDPLTQSIHTDERKSGLRLPKVQTAKAGAAYLVRMKEDGQPITSPPIPVTPQMTFGSDPIKATRILDDPSVSPLHARLEEKNGDYILTDENSTAGTWVNYEQLSSPRILRHGDILHIGRPCYRFMLRNAPERPAPRIIPTRSK